MPVFATFLLGGATIAPSQGIYAIQTKKPLKKQKDA